MQYHQLADLANEIHQRYQEEAVQRRLAAQFPPTKSSPFHLIRPITGWIGAQLIKWGEKLHERPVQPALQLASDSQPVSK